MERAGTRWDFTSSAYPRYVKMVLCATTTETNANREGVKSNPTLERAANGPNGYPSGKDSFEGYGVLNPDAAVEAVALTYVGGTQAGDTLGQAAGERKGQRRTDDPGARHPDQERGRRKRQPGDQQGAVAAEHADQMAQHHVPGRRHFRLRRHEENQRRGA
jgi:hypothetical protein